MDDSSADAELTLHALRKNALINRIHVARDGEEALNFLFCREPYRNAPASLCRNSFFSI